MLRGIYSANTAMVAQQVKEQSVSQNLANAATAGYQAQRVVFRAFPEELLWRLGRSGPGEAGQRAVGTASFGVLVDEVVTEWRPGPVRDTGRPLDLALDGPGYFVLLSPQGQVYYTRAGAFHRDAQGYLVGPQGYYVLGQRGPIYLGEGEVAVDLQGSVRVDAQVRERLLLVDFPQPGQLTPVSAGLFQAPPQAQVAAAGPRVRGGSWEAANVDPAREMVQLLSALRAYEAGQRLLQVQDELLRRAANEVGVLR